mgnify:CR=1 FL=1
MSFLNSSYNSFSQKMLMYMIANMEKNETLLACLPTGGGKSLTWQLPAISQMYQGVIIVVVPTIALAIDHERSSKNAYDKILGASDYPLAYYSGIDTEKKNTNIQVNANKEGIKISFGFANDEKDDCNAADTGLVPVLCCLYCRIQTNFLTPSEWYRRSCHPTDHHPWPAHAAARWL